MVLLKVDWVAIVQVGRVGAHFKALYKAILMAPLDLRCLFFTSQASPGEQCVVCTLDTFTIGDPDIGPQLFETFNSFVLS